VHFISRDLVKYLNDPSLYHWNKTKSIAPQVIKFFVGIVESADLELVTLLTGQFIASLLHFVDGFYSIDAFFSIFRKRLLKSTTVISTQELIQFRKFIVFIQQTGYVFSSEYESIVWTLIDHTNVSEMDTLEFLRVLSSFPSSRVIQSIPELLAAFKSWMCRNKVCLRNSIMKSIATFLGEEDGINEGTYEIADAFSCLLRCEENITEALALISPVFNVAGSIYSQPYLKDTVARKCLILLGTLPEISLSFGQEGDVYTRKLLGSATAEVLSYLRAYLFTPELDKCHLGALRTLLHFHTVNDALEPVLFDFCISTYPEALKQVHMGRPLEALKVTNVIMECYSPIAIRFDVESHIELFRAKPPTSLDPEAKKTFFHLKWKVLDVIIKELSKCEKLSAISGIYLEELFNGAVEALESAFVSYAHHVFNVLFYLVDIRFSPIVLENPEQRDLLVSNLYSCCWTAFQDFRTNEVVSESFVSLLLHPKFLTCEGLNDRGSGITFKVFHRIIPNKSLAKPLLRKCIPIWTTHLSSAEYYIDSLIELILFGDSRLEGYDAIQYAYKMQNTSEDDRNLFIRVILTLWLSELSSSKGGGNFVLQVITLLLHKSQVLESLKNAPKPTGSKKKEAKVELSLAKCGQLRAWQTVSCLLRSMPSLSSSDVNVILDAAVLALHEKHLPNIRFAVESVCVTLATRYPSAFYNETMMKLLRDPQAPDAVVKSLLVVIGISLDVMPVTNPGRKNVLLQVMDVLVVYLASTDGLHRTFSHMIFHKHFQEWFSLHAVSPTLDNMCLSSMWNFLDKNMKVVRMREKQLPYVDKFYDIFSSFSSPMSMKLSPLDFTDDFISPTLLEDVEEIMREVFFEYYNEDWYCFTELYSANRPPEETREIYAQAVQPNESNFQRKILPWSNEIESTTGAAREVMAASRKRQDIIVFASFVDKMPNIAGLVRTCEIFAASKLVIPYMKIIEREEFSHISVTAEKWIDLEEVTEDNSLGWLKRKKEVEGYSLIGLEQTAGSVPLQDYVFPEKCIIILGKEKEGIPLPVLHLVDAAVEIPQFGIIRSLNVHVAGSVLLWEYTRQQIVNKRH
jgi:tRNA G18 (ribose-2'-O)-methylase SpoU